MAVNPIFDPNQTLTFQFSALRTQQILGFIQQTHQLQTEIEMDFQQQAAAQMRAPEEPQQAQPRPRSVPRDAASD